MSLDALNYLASRFTGRIHCATSETEVMRKARRARIKLTPTERRAFVKFCVESHRQNAEVWRMFR